MDVNTSETETQTDYSAMFTQYTQNCAIYSLRQVQGAGPVLTTDEREQALNTLRYALRVPRVWPVASELLDVMAPKMEQAGFRQDWLPYLEQGIIQSQTLADIRSEAKLQRHLGLIYQLLGEYKAASAALIVSASRFSELGDPGNQALTLTRHAFVAYLQHGPEAKALVEQALILLSPDDPRREFCYFVFGALALNENDPVQAENWFRQSLALCTQLDDRRLLALRHGNLGVALTRQTRYVEAIACYERSIELFAQVQDEIQQAMMQMNLGNIYLRCAQPEKALSYYTLAEPPLRKAHDVLHLAMIDVNRGMAKRQLREWQQAEQLLRNAIERWRRLNDIPRLANAFDELGLLYSDQNLTGKAKTAFQEAIDQLNKIDRNPKNEALYQRITAHFADVKGNVEAAQ